MQQFWGNKETTQETILQLNCNSIECLRLQGTKIDNTVIGHIAKMVNLHTLEISDVDLSNDSIIGYLHRLRKLKYLSLSKTNFTESVLTHLINFPKLKYLDLSGLTIGDSGLALISWLLDLTTLDISHTMVGDEGIFYLIRMNSLNTLNLSYTNVTDNCLPHLRKIKNLRWLSLSGTKVKGPLALPAQTKLFYS